jgi:hypothetical protein
MVEKTRRWGVVGALPHIQGSVSAWHVLPDCP